MTTGYFANGIYSPLGHSKDRAPRRHLRKLEFRPSILPEDVLRERDSTFERNRSGIIVRQLELSVC